MPKHAIKTDTASNLFKRHFSLLETLMSALQSTFAFQKEWFASALDQHPAIPNYASQHNCDELFSSMGNAYAFKWTGLGFVNPGLQHATTLKAVRWAIASCYDPDPVLNLCVIPAPTRTS